MRRLTLIFVILLNFGFLLSIRNWQAYTNTSAIYKMRAYENQLLLGTWGGVSTFSTETQTFGEDFNLIDGLSDSDILDVLKVNEKTYYVTKTQGVDIFVNGVKSIPCNLTTGLLYNFAKNIAYFNII